MGFAAVEEEENKIISERHEVLRGGRGRERQTAREKEKEKQTERKIQFLLSSDSREVRCVCSVCVSVPPEGPVFVCTH